MSERDKEPCCPKCEGDAGYEYTMTVSHLMNGGWGDYAEDGDGGNNTRVSLVTCYECGTRFRLDNLKSKGLVR